MLITPGPVLAAQLRQVKPLKWKRQNGDLYAEGTRNSYLIEPMFDAGWLGTGKKVGYTLTTNHKTYDGRRFTFDRQVDAKDHALILEARGTIA